MVPGTYKLGKHYKGDTFGGVRFTLKDSVTNVGIVLTGALIKVQFRKTNELGAVIQELTQASGVTIENAIGGIFSINPFIIDWAPDTYYYDIQITFTGGVVKTYVKGTICIIQDITHV